MPSTIATMALAAIAASSGGKPDRSNASRMARSARAWNRRWASATLSVLRPGVEATVADDFGLLQPLVDEAAALAWTQPMLTIDDIEAIEALGINAQRGTSLVEVARRADDAGRPRPGAMAALPAVGDRSQPRRRFRS